MKILLLFLLCFVSLPAFAAVNVSNLSAVKNLDSGGDPISVSVTFTITESTTGRNVTLTGIFPVSQFSTVAQAKATIEAWAKECVKNFKAENAKRAATSPASTQAVSTATVDTAAIAAAQ
jgi:hypothetical protein